MFRIPSSLPFWTREQRFVLLIVAGLALALGYIPFSLPLNIPYSQAAISLRKHQREDDNRTIQPTGFAFDPNHISQEELQRLGLSPAQAASWIKFRANRSNAFSAVTDIDKLYVLDKAQKKFLKKWAHIDSKHTLGDGAQVQSFSFDPNTVSLADLQRLGLSRAQSYTFLKFRGKRHNAFKTADDILALYTLSDQQKNHLIRYAKFPEQGEVTSEEFAIDPNTIQKEELLKLGLSNKQAIAWIKFRGDNQNAFQSSADIEKLFVLTPEQKVRLSDLAIFPKEKPIENFTFDPNTVSLLDLQRLGLSEKQAQVWIKFRGDRKDAFRTPGDIHKLYILNDEDKSRLSKLASIHIDSSQISTYGHITREVPTEDFTLDANRAYEDDWQKLSGIGAYRASQIIRYRQQLGGFTSLEQLQEIEALPDSVYQDILPYIILDGGITRISINHASFNQLNRHPYISRQLANHIIRYRDKHGSFQDAQDLSALRLLDEKTMKQIIPYLRF